MADVIESDKKKNGFSLQGGSAIRNPARNGKGLQVHRFPDNKDLLVVSVPGDSGHLLR